jgi:nucleoside-diphosphate-sugar epimerase
MTTVLLTGATGLVGARLLPRLVDAGLHCRALVRRDAGLPAGVTGIRGDLSDSGSLREAVEGVEAVIHLAALFRRPTRRANWPPKRCCATAT